MLAMTFFRDNSLPSLGENFESPSMMHTNQCIRNGHINWEMGDSMRAPATMINTNQTPSEIQVPLVNDTFCATAFDWEGATCKNDLAKHGMRVASCQLDKKGKIRTACSSKKTLAPLSQDFEPLPYSILCGQGNEYFNAIGNRRFRITVSMFLERYQKARDRQEKSAIVTAVMEILNNACPMGAFIKFKKGRWWVVDEKTAREKVGAHFRDSLADNYKSSAKAKIAKRRQREQARRNSISTASSQSS